MKVAINGFGRIGRPSLKIMLEKPDVEVVAINDLGDINNLAYLLKYDTAYGVYNKEIEVEELEDKEEVDVVLECTGFFRDREGASGHLKAGARKVVISAPTKDESIKIIVLGVNEKMITVEDDILSNASCTTNCIAPVMKILDNNFGVEKSLMSTIHSYTSTQNLVDGAHKDFRRGRAAAQNIVPTSTGAAIATTKTLTQLKDKFDGMAFRVPTLDGSITDVVALLKNDVTESEINEVLARAASDELEGIVQDIIGNPHSSIIQTDLTKVVDGNLVKVIVWYDNEWGYSNRLVELGELVGGL